MKQICEFNTKEFARLNQREKDLLSLCFGKEFKADVMKKLIDNINLEDNRNYLLLLSQVCFEHDCWNELSPRYREHLKGLFRYHQISNTFIINITGRVIKALHKEGIKVLLVKGIAMRQYFDTGKVRMMSDADIVVSKEDFARAREVLNKLGADTKSSAKHSLSFVLDNVAIDLHHMIFKFYEEKGSNISERFKTIKAFDCPVQVLSNLDMFIHSLVTQTYVFMLDEYNNRHIKWIYDACCLYQKLSDEDIALLPARLKELHCENSFYFILQILADCMPQFGDLKELIVPNENFNKWLNGNLFLRNNQIEYAKERNKYSTETVSIKTILLHIKYHIRLRKYQYYKINYENRVPYSFLESIADDYCLNDTELFKIKIIDRFRIREVKNG